MEVENINGRPPRPMFGGQGQTGQPTQPKEDFTGPESLSGTPNGGQTSIGKASNKKSDNEALALASKANAALGNGGGADGKTTSVSSEDEQMAAVTEEELELAQQLIFRGHAEKVVRIDTLKTEITVASTTADDLDIINEVVYDLVKEIQGRKDETDESGQVIKKANNDVPVANIESFRNSVMLGMCVSSINGSDICEDHSVAKLKAVKAGVKRVNMLIASGDVGEAETLKTAVKKSIVYRAKAISAMPTPMLDLLSSIKANFDDRMIAVLNNANVFPKS